MKARIALALAGLALVASCGGQVNYAEHNFKSMNEIADLIGWACTDGDEDYTKVSIEKYGWAQAPCSNGSLGIWESEAKRREILDAPQNALDAGWCRIEGGNWSVSGSQFQVEEAQKKLNGKLVCK